MPAKLVLSPEAADDLGEAYRWYERRRAGLGEDFLTAVDACIQAVCRNPQVCEQVHETYRRALVRRFPYVVFYEYVDNVLTVYCVFHTSRDPEKWRERLS